MGNLLLRDISKIYDNGVRALSDIDLRIEPGEFLVVVGPSGCGKSTLLRVIAGFEKPSSGEVIIDGKTVNALEPGDRGVAMVFQDHALYPHMTARENIAFGLKAVHMQSKDIKATIFDISATLGIGNLLERKPNALSGGEKQRVSIGRALAKHSTLLLMDEPLSNLDAALRVRMRDELSELHGLYRSTVVYVTHDQIEAMVLADRIAVLKAGRLQQIGTPCEIYDSPANLFIAEFFGTPGINVYRTTPRSGAFELFGRKMCVPEELAAYEGHEVTVGIRPEHIYPSDGEGRVNIEGNILKIERYGADSYVRFEAVGMTATARTYPKHAFPDGHGRFWVDADNIIYFDGDTGERIV